MSRNCRGLSVCEILDAKGILFFGHQAQIRSCTFCYGQISLVGREEIDIRGHETNGTIFKSSEDTHGSGIVCLLIVVRLAGILEVNATQEIAGRSSSAVKSQRKTVV